jgi:tape measure domain-containing protein
MAEVRVPVKIDASGDDELKRMAAEVNKVSDSLRGLANSNRAGFATPLRGFANELRGAGGAAGGLKGVMSTLGGIFPSTFGLATMGAIGAGIAIVGVVSKVADLGAALMSAGVDATVAFGKFAVQSLMFKEDTLASLSVLLKSKDAASALYKEAIKFAAITPFSTEEVVTGYKDLIAKGFKIDELKRTFTAVGDLAASSTDPTAMTRLVYAMGQIRSAGKLMAQDLNQITGVGLNKDVVATKIAEIMGTTVADAKKAMTTGKVSGDVAIEAITRAIESQFGGMMEEKSKTLSGLISNLASKPFELFDLASDEKGGGIESFYSSIKTIVDDLNKSLFDKEGKPTETGKEIITTINQLGNALKEAVGVARAFFEGFFEGISKDHDGLNGLRNAAGELDLEKMGEEARKFGGDVATIADAVAGVSGALLRLSENQSLMMLLGVSLTVIGAGLDTIVGSAMAVIGIFTGMASILDYVISKLREMGSIPIIIPGIGNVGNIAFGGSEQPSDTRVIPATTSSSSSPQPGAGATNNSATTNNNSVAISVAGGMYPEEIANLVRQVVRSAIDEVL